MCANTAWTRCEGGLIAGESPSVLFVVRIRHSKVLYTNCIPINLKNTFIYRLYYSVRPGAHKTIVGDFSTKIANIVELVLKIRAADETEKVLIFSQWQAILMQIARALNLNGIEFRSKCSNQEFEDFKVCLPKNVL